MEVLDKIDAASFGVQDMELMGMFAQQAALAIDQSQQIENIERALVLGLKRLVNADASQASTELVATLDASLDEDSRIPDLLELADLFNELSALGEAERRACIQVLNIFAEYRRSSSMSRRFR
jgi:GAF domain-containing protein